MAGKDRFRKRDSDRSGFTYKERELVKDKGKLVGPDEFDTPPPSEVSLGGEGDISPGDIRSPSTILASTQTPARSIPIQYVTAGGGITFAERVYEATGETLNQAYIQIVGSNQAVNISANPQVTAGREGTQLTLECVGSSVTLEDGNGLDLTKPYLMDSGSLITLFFNSANSVWRETSRSHKEKLGVF